MTIFFYLQVSDICERTVECVSVWAGYVCDVWESVCMGVCVLDQL